MKNLFILLMLSISSMSANATTVNANATPQTGTPPAKHTGLLNYPKLVATLRAKDFCSCYFVVGQTKEFCKEQVKHGLPLFRMKIDEANKSVSFGLTPPVSAHVVSDRLGCAID